MFDIGFSELVLCFLVALVVLGPQRLVPLARNLGRWTGQARGYMRHLTAELERETQASELKKQLLEAGQALREQTDAAQSGLREFAAAVTPTTKTLADSTTTPPAETAEHSGKATP
jgi:sec-independent protein translocase protein TatB